MTAPVYVFTDLDDTLFQTRDKCAGEPTQEAVYDAKGDALSYHTGEQLSLLRIFATAVFIPVTGRNLAALKRVSSPRFCGLRITSHGALVWDANERLLPSWRQRFEAELSGWAWRLDEAATYARDRIRNENLSLRAKLVCDGDFPVYVSIKGDADELGYMAEVLAGHWRDGLIHRNHHNLALLPAFACKARAVQYAMELIREQAQTPPLFVGFGDSLTDVPFLKLCHYALTPQGSQIHNETWT